MAVAERDVGHGRGEAEPRGERGDGGREVHPSGGGEQAEAEVGVAAEAGVDGGVVEEGRRVGECGGRSPLPGEGKLCHSAADAMPEESMEMTVGVVVASAELQGRRSVGVAAAANLAVGPAKESGGPIWPKAR
jgi:hypothetical protein